MGTERRCSIDVAADGHPLSKLQSGTVQLDLGATQPPGPPDPPPDVSRNVLILYGGVIAYTGTPTS